MRGKFKKYKEIEVKKKKHPWQQNPTKNTGGEITQNDKVEGLK